MSCAAKSLAGKTADMEKWIRVRRVKLFLARFSWKVTWLPCGHIVKGGVACLLRCDGY